MLNEIYVAQRGQGDQEIVQLSPELRQELLTAAALIPLSAFDLRARPAPCIVCSDASETGKASVAATVSPVLSQELYRHTLQKGLWTRLLRPLPEYLRTSGHLDPGDEMPTEIHASHPLRDEAATCLAYSTLVPMLKPRTRRHINILELEAALEAEKAASQRFRRSRFVQLLDSQVALRALVKGRSASEGLNSVLRRSIAGCLPAYDYINTKANPADDSFERLARYLKPLGSPVTGARSACRGDVQTCYFSYSRSGCTRGREQLSCRA